MRTVDAATLIHTVSRSPEPPRYFRAIVGKDENDRVGNSNVVRRVEVQWQGVSNDDGGIGDWRLGTRSPYRGWQLSNIHSDGSGTSSYMQMTCRTSVCISEPCCIVLVWSYRLADAYLFPSLNPSFPTLTLGIPHYPINVKKASLQAYIGLIHVQSPV
jgi:hypothetical protein